VNTQLVEALRQLNLQPGQSMRVEVDGKDFEVHVRGQDESSDFADCVMLQPWFTIPDPPAERIVRAKPGPIDLPDPPVIPTDEEPS
jgi:hypothetical protein